MLTQTRCARVKAKRISKNDFKFTTAVDLNKCLKHIELAISLMTKFRSAKTESNKSKWVNKLLVCFNKS